MRRLLLLLSSSTYRAADFTEAARAARAQLVVASDHRPTVAPQASFLVVDFGNPEAAADHILAATRDAPPDAVVAPDDVGVVTAALVAARLGLVHHPPAAARATRDKSVMRALLDRARVPQPAWCEAGPGDEPATLATALGLPVVVKPTMLSGSRGVIRADTPADVARAAERVRAIVADAGEDPGGALLLERYVPGREVAVEGIVRDGRLDVLAVFDKPDPLEGPFFEETIYVTPSRLSPADRDAVTGVVVGGVAALELLNGPIHAEVRVENGQAWLIEVVGRSIGGLCSRTLRFGLGISLEEVVVRHALGLPLGRLTRQGTASGVMMLPVPRGGVLRAVHGRDRALAVAGVVGMEVTIAPGRPVRPLPEGDRYLGFIFARGRTARAVESSLRRAHARLEVVIDDGPAADASDEPVTPS